MAVVVIPTLSDGTAHYDVRVELGEDEFVLTFRWNEREDSWAFDLATAEGEPLLSGIKVVLGWPLLRQLSDRRRPTGDFLAVDTEGTGVEAGLLDLGQRVLLTYSDDAEGGT